MSQDHHRGARRLALAAPLAAQQQVPFRNNIPVAPQGISERAAARAPVRYETAEGQNIEVTVVTRGLARPWSLAFVANDTILVTERAGNGARDPRRQARRRSPSPACRRFAPKDWPGSWTSRCIRSSRPTATSISPTASRSARDDTAVAVARGRWDGRALRDTTRRVRRRRGDDGRRAHGVRRRRDAVSCRRAEAATAIRKIPPATAAKCCGSRRRAACRADNPFVGREGYKPEIFTLGHRSTLGLAAHPTTGQIWQVEMGPNGGDEVNMLTPGGNYGWPLVSFGRTYPGTAPVAALSARRLHRSRRVLGAVDLDVGARVLHGRRAAEVARRHLRRRHALRRDPEHGQARAHSHQREHGRAAPRAVARRFAATHPRRAAGPRRPALSADGLRRGRRAAAHRARAVVARATSALVAILFLVFLTLAFGGDTDAGTDAAGHRAPCTRIGSTPRNQQQAPRSSNFISFLRIGLSRSWSCSNRASRGAAEGVAWNLLYGAIEGLFWDP